MDPNMNQNMNKPSEGRTDELATPGVPAQQQGVPVQQGMPQNPGNAQMNQMPQSGGMYPGYGAPQQGMMPPKGGNTKLLMVIAALLVVVIVLLVVLITKKDDKSDQQAKDTTEAVTTVAATEKTTEATTEATTKATTEKTTEKTTEATTEAPKKTSKGDVIETILKEIKNTDGYVDGDYVGMVDDWNGDGYDDLLVVYQAKDNTGMYKSIYCLYTIYEDGCEALDAGYLCNMVGGNKAHVGLSQNKNGEIFLHIDQMEFQGENFNEYETYYIWRKGEKSPDKTDGFYYFEGSGSYDLGYEDLPDGRAYTRCIIGDQKVDFEEYFQATQNFYNLSNQIGLFDKPGGNVLSFDELVEKYKNEYY